MKIFVVIPAYNECKRIGHVLDSLTSKTDLPVIIVDDGSSDQTFKVVNDYIKKNSKKMSARFTVLKHKTNLGKGAALKTGCEAAFLMGCEAVIIMDSDGQHKSEDLYKFIQILKKGEHDIVFGSRNLSMGVPLVRFTGNKMASILVSILFGIYVSDLICGYRALTKKAYERICWQSTGYGVETEMVIRTGRAGLRRCEVPVETVYHDKFKGVTVLDALGILLNVLKWRFSR